MNAVPMLLSLPDGPARLIPGSFEQGQPRYERAGQPLDVDVTIPPDLEAAGWFWFGSCLYWCESGDDLHGIGVDTRTFPPPLCFEQARAIGRVRAEMDGAIQPKPTRVKRRAAPAVQVEQETMEIA